MINLFRALWKAIMNCFHFHKTEVIPAPVIPTVNPVKVVPHEPAKPVPSPISNRDDDLVDRLRDHGEI